ncbi:phage tail baseplate protein [Erythrobacter litoralis]|uniref:GTA baseplate fiber-binding domain-containing protein n=1 Tax=Erythrobacter litoralis TaxID=39960 RepID=UPI002435148F|nr:phage tail protein [Erythrobacter litoralis]
MVLTSIGSVFGPIGSAVGSLLGAAIDSRIFGSGSADGPRLKELAVSGSSYGTPIAKHYGAVRAAGTIIWSTDLVEHKEKSGGGKGQPKTTAYSYSVSFAVALASRPIDRIGRIWADGNLLRGAAGDLKTGGELRVYLGHADQQLDPAIEASLGPECPAFRGTAYVVFEDLDLSDFGNRIPALSFEVFAGSGSDTMVDLIGENSIGASVNASFDELMGFTYDGGNLQDVIGLIDRLEPVTPHIAGRTLTLENQSAHLTAAPALLAPPARWDEGDFGKDSGVSRQQRGPQPRFGGLRYYDVARDYQPGLQRTLGASDVQQIFEFPGVFGASEAKAVARKAQTRSMAKGETISWRCTELDPSLHAGALVRLPTEPGLWRVDSWEWREKGIELELSRHRTAPATSIVSNAGVGWTPADRHAASTELSMFELPWDGLGYANERRIFAAVSHTAGRWAGAALYAIQSGALNSTGQSLTRSATIGTLISALGPSPCRRLEPDAGLILECADDDAFFGTTDAAGLAQGFNRLLCGGEVIQFMKAELLQAGVWRLSGLLRGRGGTEEDALSGHSKGTSVILLDENVTPVSEQGVRMAGGEGFAAFGSTDTEPAFASVANPGRSLRPPSPVHAVARVLADRAIHLTWTRRVRGGWHWPDGVESPLVEEAEAYEIGAGSPDAPNFLRRTAIPRATLSADETTEIGGPERLWVRQIGTFASSPATAFLSNVGD